MDSETVSTRKMNPLRNVVGVDAFKVTLECGHIIIMLHGNLPDLDTKKHCVQCGHGDKAVGL